MSNSNDNPIVSNTSGVQELIDRLKNEGVADGQEKGERIVADAESRAKWLIAQAEEEAAQILVDAKKEADFITQAGKDALRMAFRDCELSLKNHLTVAFAEKINRLVSDALEDQHVLVDMICEIAGQVNPERKPATLLISYKDHTSANPSTDTDAEVNENDNDPLYQFVAGQAKHMLDQGINIVLNTAHQSAITIKFEDGKTEVLLSEKTVSELIMQYLQPRFKTLLDGLIQ